MLSHIAKHIAKNNIIINEQHGFRNKLSTITQLINTTNDWANTLNNNLFKLPSSSSRKVQLQKSEDKRTALVAGM